MSDVMLTNGTLLAERYEVVKYIAQGGMQQVYLAKDLTMERDVALKVPMNSSAEKRFERSAILSARVTHPNVAKTLDYFVEDDCPYYVEEFIEGDDLSNATLGLVPYVDPGMASKIIHNLSKALAASHHVGVVHRDIKPSNIMVTGGLNLSQLKMTDFGIAKMAEEELADAAINIEASITTNKTLIGALPYMAPEMINTPKEVDKPADIWAVGAVLFELMTGEKPFGSMLVAVNNIINNPPPALPEHVLKNRQLNPLINELYSIILSCLNKDAKGRPTADQLVSLCDNLCYFDALKNTGYVNNILHDAYGFITDSNGTNYFFHNDCVYGERPAVSESVCFSSYRGGGSDRAYPVVKMKG